MELSVFKFDPKNKSSMLSQEVVDSINLLNSTYRIKGALYMNGLCSFDDFLESFKDFNNFFNETLVSNGFSEGVISFDLKNITEYRSLDFYDGDSSLNNEEFKQKYYEFNAYRFIEDNYNYDNKEFIDDVIKKKNIALKEYTRLQESYIESSGKIPVSIIVTKNKVYIRTIE